MKFGGELAKRTSHKLHILSSRLIFFSITHIHIQMTCLSSLKLHILSRQANIFGINQFASR
jgi:hypothetical protein